MDGGRELRLMFIGLSILRYTCIQPWNTPLSSVGWNKTQMSMRSKPLIIEVDGRHSTMFGTSSKLSTMQSYYKHFLAWATFYTVHCYYLRLYWALATSTVTYQGHCTIWVASHLLVIQFDSGTYFLLSESESSWTSWWSTTVSWICVILKKRTKT